MSHDLTAHFDGNAIVPDEPLALAPGQRLRVHIEMVGPEEYPLTQIAKLATDMGVEDLADRHNEYARRMAKEPPNE